MHCWLKNCADGNRAVYHITATSSEKVTTVIFMLVTVYDAEL